MNAETFKQQIKKPNHFSDVLNYTTCVAFLGIGVFFTIKCFKDFHRFPDLIKYFVFVLPLMMYAFGGYGIWRLRITYAVRQINSNRSLQDKLNAIETYFTNYTITSRQDSDNYISVRLRNKLFTGIDASFYVDADKVLFYAEGADAYRSRRILDFGIGNRVMNKIDKHLHTYLAD